VAFHVVLDSITAKEDYNTAITAVVIRTNSLRRSLGDAVTSVSRVRAAKRRHLMTNSVLRTDNTSYTTELSTRDERFSRKGPGGEDCVYMMQERIARVLAPFRLRSLGDEWFSGNGPNVDLPLQYTLCDLPLAIQ
jgi:hypothetical protein